MSNDLTVRATLDDELSRPLEGVRAKVRAVGDETSKAGAKAKVSAGGFGVLTGAGGRLGKLAGGALKLGVLGAATAIGAVGTAAIVAGPKLLALASDAAETKSKFDTIFQGSTAVTSWVKGMHDQFGLATADLQNYVSSVGVLGKSAGLSGAGLDKFATQTVGMMLDAGSFYNASTEDVAAAFQSGLSGEYEGLRQFGVFLNEETVKQQATRMGLMKGGLTEQEKIAARQAAIWEQFSKGPAQGDLAKTATGFANMWRGVQGRLKEAATQLGTGLLPAATAAVGALSGLIAGVNWEAIGSGIGGAVAAFTGTLMPALSAVGSYVSGTLWPALSTFGAGVAAVLGPPLAAVGGFLASTVVPAVTSFGGVLAGSVAPALSAVGGFLSSNATAIQGLGAAVAGGVAAFYAMRGAVMAYQAVMLLAKAPMLAATAAQWALNVAMSANPIGIVVVAIGALVAALVWFFTQTNTGRQAWAAFTGFIVTAWNTATGALSSGFNAVVGWFQALPGRISGGMAAFGAMIGTGIARAVAWFAGLPGRVQGSLSSFAARVAAGAALAALRLWSKIKAGIDRAVAFVQGLPGRAVSALGSLGSVLSGVASSAVDGFLGFFRDLPSRVMGLLGDVANGIMSWRPPALSMPSLPGLGDTASSKATGASSWTGALPHMSAGQSISNIGIGGGGTGRGSGDHQRGAAVDVVGPNLSGLIRTVKGAGGYGALHGYGASRHAHLVPAGPAGDTTTSRIGFRSSSSSSSAATVAPVNLTVHVHAVGRAAEDPHELAARFRKQVDLALREATERG